MASLRDCDHQGLDADFEAQGCRVIDVHLWKSRGGLDIVTVNISRSLVDSRN